MPAAVVLAGDRIASKPIQDENKAFLEFRGEPMYVHVVRALVAAEQIDTIIVVGPYERLVRSLETHEIPAGDKKIAVAPQGLNLVENVLVGHMSSLGVDFTDDVGTEIIEKRFDEYAESAFRETPVLVVSCDIPLVTSYEIDEFVTGVDMEQYDYAVGLSDDSVMAPYLPTESTPGLTMSCFHFAESRCRHNNMHYGKPLKATQMHNVERMYELRYQKKLVNMAKMILHLIRAEMSTFTAIRLFVFLQIARSLGERGRGKLYEWVRSNNRLDRVMSFIGSVIGMRIQGVFTRYGGAVMDVDNADDLAVADEMYDRWMDFQRQIYETSK